MSYTGSTRKTRQGCAWNELSDFCSARPREKLERRRLHTVKQNSDVGSSFTS